MTTSHPAKPLLWQLKDNWFLLVFIGGALLAYAELYLDSKYVTEAESPATRVTALESEQALQKQTIEGLQSGQTEIKDAITNGFDRSNDRYDQLVEIMLDDR